MDLHKAIILAGYILSDEKTFAFLKGFLPEPPPMPKDLSRVFSESGPASPELVQRTRGFAQALADAGLLLSEAATQPTE